MTEKRDPRLIKAQLDAVRKRIQDAEIQARRPLGTVRLIAVSKTRPAADLRSAYAAGQREFGENYLQEAVAKMTTLTDLNIIWHFIGPIQTNKSRSIAEHFDWVHSVDRLKVAKRLSEQRPADREPLDICIQVNVSGESTKSGVALPELPALAAAIADLPRLRLRGLMAIPQPYEDPEQQRIPFLTLRSALEQLQQQGMDLDTLSMGMTDDLEAAILEGATMVRVGTAIFGSRSR